MAFANVTKIWKEASSIVLANVKTRKILMLKRGSTAKFMPNSMVFPGGVVEDVDKKLGDPSRICALRELFEESGILLTKDGFESSVDDGDLRAIKDNVKTDSNVFSKVAHKFSTDRLLDFETFLTPATAARRYYTKFFLGVLNEEPKVDLCTSEMSEYCWIDPIECVEQAFAEQFILPPPQVYMLTRLSQIKNWEDCDKYCNQTPICPQPIHTETELIHNVFPGDHLYINNDCFVQPGRQMKLEELKILKTLPTHRVVYKKKPVYARCEVYMHNLKEEDAKKFHQFETHSKLL
ncbi:unnamed protein product [Caenorhabditis bovis]|uniref:Nudix hydrolase domain-containing protein n=1 Tax=Caenorhabditis bovis TaxID=2654633 RepID=A0A8S1F9W8_9PELO|nr:unnamed protein product [Caenorhabditis bovis]